ncbi:ATP-binding protein [Pedobacter faecalis]|uniref:ATP-binding protein n=1 Tax=Pedobacter faecalis TaxID=3041495 RepID=UPI00254D85D8|nr:ATP-binding protein [Pedobacter sp. ELA7]
MNNITVDLTNCDREPIHIPGKVQSHGCLIAVDGESHLITYASENVQTYLNVSAKDLLGKHIGELSGSFSQGSQEVDFPALIKIGRTQQSFDAVNPYRLLVNGEAAYLVIHQSATDFVLEFEPATLEYDIQNVIGRSVSEILANKTLAGLLHNAAREVKNIIEYDRVMIYKFQEDGHGEVVAEVKNDDLEPFFGLHYPASDIPKQARELYKLNYTRIIADVNAEASPILTFEPNKPLDLTHSCLRAVSPVHIQYLKNMGVASSFSISLISNGELWGLIACHSYSPKFIDYKAREGAKLIGQILSSALEYREMEEETERDNVLKEAVQEIGSYLEKDADLIAALTKYKYNLQQVTHASGVAILFEDEMHTLGETPSEEDLKDIFKWLKRNMSESIYHTSQFPEVYTPAKKYADTASGIFACMLSRELGELIVWFKPEQIRTINWAGNPEKPMEPAQDTDPNAPAGLMMLSPRNSFESWAQIVKNTSARWSQIEISTVLKLRERIITTINQRANEIRQLNERLKLAYDELDTFSYTISHDLRTPLTSIKSYTELFLAQHKDLDERGKSLLNRVVAGADKMGFLINEILKLARVGRSEIDFVQIDMPKLLSEISTEVISALKAEHVKIEFGDCPDLEGDHTLISQVFSNLIGNAVKYSQRSEAPVVRVEAQTDKDQIVYNIKDNGIGIDVNYHDKVFELFKRMENVRDYEGTGVGLAIVKRIIEKHNGRIWFESELGVGTTFYVAFKK